MDRISPSEGDDRGSIPREGTSETHNALHCDAQSEVPQRTPLNNMHKETRWLLEEKYHGTETPEFFADLKRLEAGEPLAYVIGWTDFLGCHIDLSAHPLIPRPETEFWVEQVIRSQQSVVNDQKTNILDLFSGSGCIGIALAKHLPNTTVDFGEKDPKFCEQIAKNITANNIAINQTRVIQTDVFSRITDSYDYIFANPPYIDPTKKATVEESVLRHEPHGALFAGSGGLTFITQLLAEARAHLHQGGILMIEFGANQKEDIARLARAHSWNIEFEKDQFGEWRIATLRPRP